MPFPILESQLDRINFEALVSAESAGYVTPDELETLRGDTERWVWTLRVLLQETEDALAGAERITGEERAQVVADLDEERLRLRAALRRVGAGEDDDETEAEPEDEAAGVAVLQASWDGREVVVWAANRLAQPLDPDELRNVVAEAGAGTVDWSTHRGVPLPSGKRAPAFTTPVSGALGWLVGVGAGQLGTEAGPSVQWLGEVAVWATELVALGRMAPTLVRSDRANGNGRHTTGRYEVRWAPAVVDGHRLRELASRMPGSVAALAPPPPSPERLSRAVLSAAVDAICRAGAARLVTAATAAVARNRSDVAEAVLAGLDGTAFTAAARPAGEMADELKRWAAPVLSAGTVGLVARLDAPEKDGGWLLTVEVTGIERQPLPVEKALAAGNRAKAQEADTQLRRLERLLPPLLRPSRRRGQVVLGADEAWDLMTGTGAALVAAGFDVRVPAASLRRTGPRLHMRADAAGPSKVGAQQLSKVRWSVLFGDAELNAADIARLAAQARPLVRVKGKWVELERSDLDAAARALAEQLATTELSGAAILRHAVGLEGTALGGPVVVDGAGWAVDLVKGATESPPQPLQAPDGFLGELRSYQAEARGWLEFLDGAGLGGCLAMDMGLGKTPTVLAHLLATRGQGPVLVVAPPAVLGNWAAEAARFTPELRVRVHHGTARATADELAQEVADADVLLTTYATAVRDVEALAGVEWHRAIVDEAQTIKNPASDTAQQLRRIPARSRVALTGTPIENGLGDLWSILDFTNPGLVGPRPAFIEQLSRSNGGGRPGDAALRALNGLLVFRRSKTEPEIAAELPDKIDELDHCGMTPEQIGLYQAVLDRLVPAGSDAAASEEGTAARKGQILAAITALKQICDHPAAYLHDDREPLEGRSGKLTRLNELLDSIFEAGERVLIFTHFATWGERLAEYLTERAGLPIACYHGGLSRTLRDRLVQEFQGGSGPGALVLSIKAGGSGLNLTAASHVVLYDRWWNPAVEDQARDRAWRIGQKNAVVSHRLVCPGTVDERVEEVVAGKRIIADLALPASSSLADLGPDQLRAALGLRPDQVIAESVTGAAVNAGAEETAA